MTTTDQYTRYQREPNLEDLDNHEGVAEQEELFGLDLPDEEITKNLNNRINTSRTFWNDPASFNLKERRIRNSRFVVGDHWHDVPVIGQALPYVQNEVFTAEQVIASYITSRLPELEVYPSQDTPEARRLAQNVGSMLKYHSEQHNLQGILCNIVLSLLNNYIGVIEFEWDPNCGPFGDIVPKYTDPGNMIVDKRAKQDANPSFISLTKQNTAEELCAMFPDKSKEIMGKVQDSSSAVITWRHAWFTYFEDKKAQEGVCAWFEDIVMMKNKNPNWIYDEETEGTNILPYTMKPYIPFNYLNDGDHWIDRYGPIDQAIPLQLMIDRIGKQIQQGISHASPILVFNKRALDKPNADRVTGQPWEKILVDAEDVRTAYGVIQAAQVPAYVINEIERLTQTLHKIFGTPPQLQGESQDQTATQDLMARNQAQGRQDLLVRAIDRGLDMYFKYLLQMMKVYYTEDHFASVLGEDGRYDFVTLNRDKIEDGIKVTVKAGSTLPMDKSRMESVALNLAKMNKISLLSLYEFLDVPNPGKHVERLIKEQVDAVSVVEDIKNDDQDANAVEDFEMIRQTGYAPPRDDADPSHMRTHNKQLTSNEVLGTELEPGWPPDRVEALRTHIQSEVDKIKLQQGITDDQLYPPPPPVEDPSFQTSINPQSQEQGQMVPPSGEANPQPPDMQNAMASPVV